MLVMFFGGLAFSGQIAKMLLDGTNDETPAGEVVTHTWDFTKWSDATVADLKAEAAKVSVSEDGTSVTDGGGAKWSDCEKTSKNTTYEASKDNCFWYVGGEAEPTANGNVIAELKGLTFDTSYGAARSLAIAVNYPETSLGTYNGPAYLWLGGKGKDCFTIKNVKVGSQLSITAESHKPSEGRGVQLKIGGENFGDSFTPTTLETQTWTITSESADLVDVVVSNTNGCHIYYIDAEIGEPAEEPVVEPGETTTIFSWEGNAEGAIVSGGAVTATDAAGADLTADDVNTVNSTYNVIRLRGAKDFSTNVVVITLDKALKAGDEIAITAYRNKNDADKKTGALLKFENGSTTVSTATTNDGLEFVNIDQSDESANDQNRGTEPNTVTLTVPSDAAGSKTITMTRAITGTNLFITKIEITGERNGEEEETPTTTTVVYDIADVEGIQGVAPTGATLDSGAEFTIPQNFTLYVEGKTLTAWTDGTAEYAVGSTVKAAGETMTLKPVFTKNSVNLGDQKEPVTVKFDFQRKNGAPAVGWEGQTGLVWVTQATVNGKTIDVKADLSTSPGKFANANWDDWCQLNNGTTFTIPSAKGAVVSVEGYNTLGEPSKDGQTSFLTIDGQSDYTHAKVVSYTIASSNETVNVVIGEEGSYYRYIQVVLPKVEKDDSGLSFDNVAGTVSWQVGNEEAGTVSEELTDAFTIASATIGSDLNVSTKTVFGQTMLALKPGTSNPGNKEEDMVEYRVKVASGLTFKPTTVSYDAVKNGTDNATYSWSYVIDGVESSITTVSKDDIVRNNNTTGTPPMNHSFTVTTDGCSEFALRIYVSGFSNAKDLDIANIVINGIVDGTVADVEKYVLSAVAAPAEAGTINIYPFSEQYEAGSEVKLTATENFGYDFVNWTDAVGVVVSEEPVFTYTLNSDAALTANFVAVETFELALTVDGTNDYMVKISPAPEMVDGKMMYEAGQAVQLQADQYEGLVTFTNWSDGETNSSKLVSMTADVELTAFYAGADILAGWDFYKAGGSGRKADFASADNESAALNLVYPDGHTSGWLDKSTEAAGGYESFAGAATNWRNDVEIGTTWWQTKVNAEAFTDINVQFQMLYNYNAYQTYDAEYSLDGENWTKFGSITMTGAKKVASFNEALPEEANNQAELYIRMIADKTSNIDGTSSANDGNTLAMFFITGTPKLVDDGVAPVLVSTVPENGATGASATGKIVLTFDERVKLADTVMPTATLGNQTLTPTVSGKAVTFDYKGLEYSTEYTFTLPGGSIADLTDNFITDDITLTFTTMVRPTVEKQLYDFIVPDDGTFAEALKAAAARSDQNVRYRIFVKQGEYVIPAGETGYTDNNGNYYDYPDPRTYFNSPNVSIIGENPANTSITNEMPNSLVANADAGGDSGANPVEGIRSSGVLYLQSGATDTYFQDIKLWSATADNTGRNVVLVDGGNRTVCKNVTLWAYQDTYVSDNTRSTYYFEGGLLRGRTDFLCGSGDVFYNNVTLQMCQDGGYIAVPRDNVKYGYVFKDCTIKGETSKVDGNYYLGRPWTEGAEAYFIDTKMEVVPRAIGWAEMSAGGCTRMAEWNSMTANGSQVDLTGRAKTLGKTTPNPNNPVLTAEEALEIGNLHNMFGDWDPTLLTEQAPVPANLKQEGNYLVWDDSNYALLWAIVKDGQVIGFTTEPKFELPVDGQYAVRAANEMGGLCEQSETVDVTGVTTGIFEAENPLSRVPETIYNLNGIRVDKAHKGLYIVGGKKTVITK